MSGEKYKDIDVPFCVNCSRFMVKDIGIITVHLNHESDEMYMTRAGRAYKCPECGHKVIYKWLYYCDTISREIAELDCFWYIFLEDHTHYNKYKGYDHP